MATPLRLAVQHKSILLTADARMCNEDHHALNNVYQVLRQRFLDVKVRGIPQHYDTCYTVQFITEYNMPYKTISEVHLINQRLIKNIRMSTIEEQKQVGENATMFSIMLVIEVTFGYHQTSQLSKCSHELLSTPHNWLLGYEKGAQEFQTLVYPKTIESLPVDDQIVLQQLIHMVYHMRPGLPLMYMQLTNLNIHPAKDSMDSSQVLTLLKPNAKKAAYALSFFNVDYVDSDFLDYLTQLLGSRISSIVVAPHMFELQLPTDDKLFELESSEDEGHDADTEDETDDEGHSSNSKDQSQNMDCSSVNENSSSANNTTTNGTTELRKKRIKCATYSSRIPSIRLTLRVQSSNALITQMYGIPDDSVTKALVNKASPTSSTALRNLNVGNMWRHLGQKRKGVTLNNETDIETDTEDAHNVKRKL